MVPTDVACEAQCRTLVERAVAHFGGVDVLVNNAGPQHVGALRRAHDLSVYERIMRVNYLGCVWLTHAALPHLKRSRGQIVVVGSLLGFTGVPTRTGYAASKHAVIGFFDSLRIELIGTGVDVTMVAPDFVVTEIHRRSVGPDGRAARRDADAGVEAHDRGGVRAHDRARDGRRGSACVIGSLRGSSDASCGSSRPA